MNAGEDDRQMQAERMMIEEIKKRPYLWDDTLPEHKDMEKARSAWESVGRLFGMSGKKKFQKKKKETLKNLSSFSEDPKFLIFLIKWAILGSKAKSKWKSMRDIYVRYLRKLALKGGSVPKWKHFEAMNFIADHIKHRR